MKQTQSFKWKPLVNYLFWIGPVLIVMGLTASAVLGIWSVVPIALVIAGFLVIGLWLLWQGYKQPNFWGRRATQVSTNALLSTLAVLAIVGMVNLLAVRFASRLDLTENQIFTLAPQSQEVTQSLQQPVKVWVFVPNPSAVDRELLENYRRQNNQLSYEFVDPQAQPGIARQFGVQSVGEVYLEAGSNRRLVQTIAQGESLSERKLTNGLAQLSTTQQQKIYFLQGHGEKPLAEGEGGLSQASGRLQEESFVAEPLNLATNPQVPEDATVVVVAGAQRPLLGPEVTALQDYLKRQGGLMLMIDPQTDPKLEGLLSEWGVRVSDRIVIDPAGQASGLGPGVTIVNQYGDHPITRGFGNGFSFYPLARPLEVTKVDRVEEVTLLFTSDRTTAQRVGPTGELQFDAAQDPKGPFNIGTALTRSVAQPAEAAPTPEAAPDPEARLVVIGNSAFVTNGLFEQQLNGDLFLNATTWLSQRGDEVLSIRPREATSRRIVMSPGQILTTTLVALVFLPLLAFSVAAGVWWRRRA